MTIRSYFLGCLALIPLACSPGGLADLDDELEDIGNEWETEARADVDISGALDDLEDKIKEFDVEFTMHNSRYDDAEGRFIEKTPSTHVRNLFSVHSIDGQVYVIGGLNEDGNYVDTFERYDPATDAWENLPDWPRTGFAHVMVVGRHLCTIGGYKNLAEPIRKDVDCYDVDGGTWIQGPDVPESYSSFYPVSYDGRVYVLGGSDDDFNVMSSTWIFDPLENSWEEGAHLPSPRALAGVQPVGSKIYVTGGFGPDTFSGSDSDSDAPQDTGMLVYDPAANTWETAPDMPHARALYALDEIEGKLAVFFGLTDGPLLEFFDPATGTWKGGMDPEELPSGGVYTYARHDGKIHLLAVADESTSSSLESSGALWRYDLAADEWSNIAHREAEQDALFSGASVGDAIHWIGAHTTFIVPDAGN
jgi:hypothetical protein